MQTPATLQRTLQSLFITGIYIFALAPAFAADAPKVTAGNYVRAESDFQMKGYIESYNNFGSSSNQVGEMSGLIGSPRI